MIRELVRPFELIQKMERINDEFFKGLDLTFKDFDEIWFEKFKYDDFGRWIVENENDYKVVKVVVPGVSKDELKIELEDRVLVISCEVKKDSNKERFVRSFTKRIALSDVDIEKIDAELKDGVLNIKLPKIKNESKKLIEIK